MFACMLPQVLLAGMGLGPGPDLPALDAVRTHRQTPPPDGEKAVYTDSLAWSYNTSNFTIQWYEDAVDEGDAEAVGAVLEDAWALYVEEWGWQQPVSSDTYLVWVVLSTEVVDAAATVLDTMGGTEYADGVPVIYLNPTLLKTDAALAQAAAHEFAHALHYRVRDSSTSPNEAWFWEASAEWMASQLLPDIASESSAWYAADAGSSYDVVDGAHERGMLMLVAALQSEDLLGAGGLESLWRHNSSADWLTEIEDATGLSAVDVWTVFTGSYASGALADSDLYASPVEGELDGTLTGQLGSVYIPLDPQIGKVVLSGGSGLLAYDGTWESFEGEIDVPPAGANGWLVVTNPTSEPLEYSVSFKAGGAGGGTSMSSTDGCNCATSPGPSGTPWLLAACLGLVRRRRRAG